MYYWKINELDELNRDSLCQEVNTDLSDPELSKREVILRAVVRLDDQIASLERLAYDSRGENNKDDASAYAGLSEGSMGAVLNDLPVVINGFSIRIFDVVTALHRMLHARDVDQSDPYNDLPL